MVLMLPIRCPPQAAAKSDFTKALTEGKPILDARYRYEYVDQDGLANEANAHIPAAIA